VILPIFLFFQQPPATNDVEANLKKFTQVLAIAQAQAADPVNTETAIYQGAIPNMLAHLDPHSVFFDPNQFEQLKEMEHAESKGFGTVVSILPGRVIILQATAGTPSGKAGLAPGDEILAVNNVALSRLDPEQLVQFLGQARQQTAYLIVRRPGSARMLTFTLNPELVDTPSVDRKFLLKPGIAYVRVASWDPKTGLQLKEAIEKLGGEKLKGLVLDLRNNPGGVVQAALDGASLFLKPGQNILSVKGRNVKGETADVPKTARPYTFPVSILINEKTASASEILTGALQDHDRATVVGEPSYGKGLVQNVMTLTGNTALALTTAFYYTPSGRSIQKPLRTGQLEIEQSKQAYRTDSGRVVHGGGGIEPDVVAGIEAMTRLRAALDASGVMTAFATGYIRQHKIDEWFDVTPEILDQFEVYAAEHGIQPSFGEWSQERAWVTSRLKQEIVNQGVSIEKGDEVEAQRDPQVREAVKRLGVE
jgi:carboxyl-terminal processing protease